MAYITVNKENSANIDLYYEDHGKGKPVVLIHGFPLNGDAWEKQTPELLAAGCRVITYDRRGFGKSSRPAIGYDYDTFSDDLNKLMERLDLSDATLVGHSMGTGEVIRYLSKYGSKRVGNAVVISPIAPFLVKTPDNPGGLGDDFFEGFKKMIRSDRPAFMTAFFENFYNYDVNKGKSVSEEAFRASWNRGVEASPLGTYACVATWATDFRADLPKIDVPLMIIHGTADRVLPYALTALRLEKLVKASKLVTVQDGPHSLPWTNADIVNRELLTFIGQQGKGKAAA